MSDKNVPTNTPAYFAQAGIAFAVSATATVLGAINLPMDIWQRSFMLISVLFLVSSSFTLAKVVRDHQEQSSVRIRIDEARLERLLSEHEHQKTVV